MSFESYSFGLFALTTISLYWASARSRVAQKWVLLSASVLFYGLLGWGFVALLAVHTVANWGVSARIDGGPQSARWLRVGVGVNLGLLGFFKYYDFFRESLADALGVLGLTSHLPALQIVLPIGISFYCFQAIAHLVELHRGASPRAKNLLDFALFQSFFVQLLMGPICRGRHLLPQLEAPAPKRLDRVPEAISLIAVGLFKRMVLASALFSHGVAEAFFAPDNFSAAALWVAMIGYTVQIYCDFSGYTDLMRGVALLMGFDIPDNFNRPYIATSVGDFWRRWHITFSNWLRDFIYFPMGGSRVGKARTYLNLFTTMFVCGIWHGASWGYVIWGTVHGVALVLYKVALDAKRARGIDPKKTPSPLAERVAGWFWTMGIVCFSRVFFVSPDLSTAGEYLTRMFDRSSAGAGFGHVLVVATIVGLAWNFVGHRVRDGHAQVARSLPKVGQVAFWAATLLFLLLIRPGGVSPNAYFGF